MGRPVFGIGGCLSVLACVGIEKAVKKIKKAKPPRPKSSIRGRHPIARTRQIRHSHPIPSLLASDPAFAVHRHSGHPPAAVPLVSRRAVIDAPSTVAPLDVPRRRPLPAPDLPSPSVACPSKRFLPARRAAGHRLPQIQCRCRLSCTRCLRRGQYRRAGLLFQGVLLHQFASPPQSRRPLAPLSFPTVCYSTGLPRQRQGGPMAWPRPWQGGMLSAM
jgi:hypothetical protein